MRLTACLFICLAALSARADNWPQWRGPNHDGVTAASAPTEWGPDKNIAWKLKTPGIGGSTPIIWGERIFFTSEEGDTAVLVCASTAGQELWKRKISDVPTKTKFMLEEQTGASPSPSTDGTHVYALAGSGAFVAFDFDGKEVWRFNAQERYGKFRYQFGLHSTPVLHDGKLYAQFIHSIPGLVVCIDAKTGANVWKVERPSDGHSENEHSYASPTMWRKGDRALLLVQGNDYCTAHELKDGAEVWRLGGLNPKASYDPTLRFVASPLATPDLIVVPTAKKGPTVAVKPNAHGNFAKGSEYEAWRINDTPDVPSPLLLGNYVYLCKQTGRLRCLDAATGKDQYYETIHAAKYRASPTSAGGNIYVTGRDGVVTVVKAGPKFEVIATNKLPDITAASPVFAGGRLYLRGYDYLYAIGK